MNVITKSVSITLLILLMAVRLSFSDEQDIEDLIPEKNTLTVILPYFTFVMPKFYEGEENPQEGSSDFMTDISAVMNDTILHYVLWGFIGRDGELFNNDVYIVNQHAQHEILSVEQRYTTTLLFNEDGSGGVWGIAEINGVESEWLAIDKINEAHFRTLDRPTFDRESSSFNDEQIAIADAYVAKRDVPTTYWEDIIEIALRIQWRADGKTIGTILSFEIWMGD